MESFDQIYEFLLTFEGIGLNSNILETGLINNLILIIFLYIFGLDILGPLLSSRLETIENNLKQAKIKVEEANKRLKEAEKQLAQANIIIYEIKAGTLVTKKNLIEASSYNAKAELTIYLDRALGIFKSREREIFNEVKSLLISLVLKRLLENIKQTFNNRREHSQFVTNTLLKLKQFEGEIL